MPAADLHERLDAIWRVEAPKVIGALTRMVRDLALAEDFAQDALLVALEQWPESGVPNNPGAWLMATAKRRAIDHLRRREMLDRKHDVIRKDAKSDVASSAHALETSLDNDVDDDVLRLMFIACHPVLATEARVALTLRMIGGLTTAEIARAFVVPEPTMAQRLVRAKRALAEAAVLFELPRGEARQARVSSLLDVLYLIFNEGYAATGGEDWTRPALCEEALRLAHLLARLMPGEADVFGLVALMSFQASRLATRIGASGEPILLADQDRSRWNRSAIAAGEAALARAEASGLPPGAYTLQAAIAACHALAPTADDTDWARIVALYGALVRIAPSPIVELNRAVAVARSEGPAAALVIVERLVADGALARYHLLPSVHGDLLLTLGRHTEAREAFEQAAALATNARERRLLTDRADKAGLGSELE